MTSPRCAACWGVFPAATTRGATARCQRARADRSRAARAGSYVHVPKAGDLRCARASMRNREKSGLRYGGSG